MSLYVEVMCDAYVAGTTSNRPGCVSFHSDNPRGSTVAEARMAARRAGWKVASDNSAICPNCLPIVKASAR